MSTIIETNDPVPSNRTTVVGSSDNGGAGWAIAILILVVAIVAGAFWYMRYHVPEGSNTGSTIQVNLPSSGYPPANSGNAPAQAPAATPAAAPAASPATAPATTPAPTTR